MEIARGETNADGRIADWLDPGPQQVGTYRITFDTGAYFASRSETGFYPFVPVVFEITSPGEHHHVPLLLNPFGYSTYRGS
jgi:5-hydroxyisourate hydrolase